MEDSVGALQVRWDWENDGTWDTDYRTLKTITKVFTDPRTYYIVEYRENNNIGNRLKLSKKNLNGFIVLDFGG